MKYLAIALLCLSVNAQASVPNCKEEIDTTEVKEQLVIDTKVPGNLKGATIVVRLADGTETSVPAEKFKLVPRKQQYIVTKTEVLKTSKCTIEVVNTARKNRLSLLGGWGAKGGLTSQELVGNAIEVESRTGLVVGVQYQRLVTERLSFGLQAQTSKTASLLLGLDF